MGEIENYSGFNISTYQVLRSHTNFFGELSPPKGYGGIYIEGDEIKEIRSVKRIKGYLVLHHTTALVSLGSVRKIEGDFRMQAIQSTYVKDFDLGILEEVDGNIDLNQRVSDFANLKIVRGKIKANNSRVATLGRLKQVEGDIILNEVFKGLGIHPSFFVQGKLRFWKRDYDIKLTEPTKIPSHYFGYKVIPEWKNKTVTNNEEILNTTDEIKSFYKIFKENFTGGKPIDLKDSFNYLYTLIYEFKSLYQSGILSRSEFIKKLEKVAFYYPICRYDIQEEIKLLFDQSSFTSNSLNLLSELISNKIKFSLEVLYEIDTGSSQDIILSEPEILFQVFTSTDFPLTKYGKENFRFFNSHFRELIYAEILNDQVIGADSVISRKSLWNLFLTKYEHQVFIRNLAYYSDLDELINYYSGLTDNYRRKEIYGGVNVINEMRVDSYISICLQHWIIREGMRILLRHFLRKAENVYRESQGLESVESSLIWKSENELFELVSSAFPNEIFVQQATPKWLGDQRFDIYLPHRNIAIEYQGRQHYEAVDFFGGEKGLKKTQELDRKKKEKCRMNGCQLLIVDEGYRFQVVREKLKLLISQSNFSVKVDFSSSSPPKYEDPSVVRVGAETIIYDCKEQKEITLAHLLKIYPNLKVEVFKNRRSYLKRYILSDSDEGEKVKESWKTIMDTYTGEKYRFNRIEFANFVNVPSNNVWNFFNGKQKLFHQRYRIL